MEDDRKDDDKDKKVEGELTKPELVRVRPKRIRSNFPPQVSNPESGQERLYKLVCFKEMDEMIRTGKYCRDVAYFIQEQRGELRDLTNRAVIYLLRRYKEDVFSDENINDGTGEKLPGMVDVDDPFYEVHAMRRRFRELESRIDMEVQTEMGLSKLFSNTHKEYLTLEKMANNIIVRQEKLGLLSTERGSSKQRIGSGQPGRIDVGMVVQDPEKRHRVLTFVEAFIRNPRLMEDIVAIDGEKKDKHQKKTRKRKPRARVKDDRHHRRRTSSVKKNE